jgi:hypothetical protein
MTATFHTYEEFWPFYLSQHSKRETRILHAVGTGLALIALLKALFGLSLFWLIMAPVLGYGTAWIGHAFIEKNHPATFDYPLWSLRGDFDMLRLLVTGQLEAELVKYKIST